MSRNSINRKSTLLAIALGLTALGSTTMPAAAMPGRFFFGQNQMMPSHFGGGGQTIGDVYAHTHVPSQMPELPKSNTGPVASKTIGDGKPLPPPSGHLPNGVDNVCPFNPIKCHQKGAGDGSTTGTGSSGGSGANGGSTNTGSNTNTGGGSGTVVVVPSAPVMIPTPVVVQNPPIMVAPRLPEPPRPTKPRPTEPPQASDSPTPASNPSDPATEPCKCLVKQYLGDGSVLFRDVCTHEAAVATKAEAQALAAAAADAQPQVAPRQ